MSQAAFFDPAVSYVPKAVSLSAPSPKGLADSLAELALHYTIDNISCWAHSWPTGGGTRTEHHALVLCRSRGSTR